MRPTSTPRHRLRWLARDCPQPCAGPTSTTGREPLRTLLLPTRRHRPAARQAGANAALIRALQAWFRPSLRGPVHAGRVHARSVVARRAASRSATPTAWHRPTRNTGRGAFGTLRPEGDIGHGGSGGADRRNTSLIGLGDAGWPRPVRRAGSRKPGRPPS